MTPNGNGSSLPLQHSTPPSSSTQVRACHRRRWPQPPHTACSSLVRATSLCGARLPAGLHPTGIVLDRRAGQSAHRSRRRALAGRPRGGRAAVRPGGRARSRRWPSRLAVAALARALTEDRRMIDLVAEQSPLGGLERWLHDPTITELMVNGGNEVWIERAGRLEHVGSIRGPTTLLGAIEHILAPLRPTAGQNAPHGGCSLGRRVAPVCGGRARCS